MKTFIHPTTKVDRGAKVGAGTQIWHFSHVMKGARIGEKCKIGQNVVIHSTARIGDCVKIQNNVSIYDGVVLEDHVFCGPSCVFTNVTNPRAEFPRSTPELYEKTLVRQGATIGANATVLCGIRVGRYAFVGAGAVVTKNVGDYELVVGNPARVKGWMCQCGEKLKFSKNAGRCSHCSRKYKKSGRAIQCQEPKK